MRNSVTKDQVQNQPLSAKPIAGTKKDSTLLVPEKGFDSCNLMSHDFNSRAVNLSGQKRLSGRDTNKLIVQSIGGLADVEDNAAMTPSQEESVNVLTFESNNNLPNMDFDEANFVRLKKQAIT